VKTAPPARTEGPAVPTTVETEVEGNCRSAWKKRLADQTLVGGGGEGEEADGRPRVVGEEHVHVGTSMMGSTPKRGDEHGVLRPALTP